MVGRQWVERTYGDVKVSSKILTVTVETPLWVVRTTSKPIYKLISPIVNESHVHRRWLAGQKRLDISIDGTFPQLDAHGIIGQSYRDDRVRNGRMDEYGIDTAGGVNETVIALATSDGTLPPMTTNAQAEGAIDGVHTDYKLASASSTDFKFSTFHQAPLLPLRAKEAQAGGVASRAANKRTATTTDWEGYAKNEL